jgi:hypothetical protein
VLPWCAQFAALSAPLVLALRTAQQRAGAPAAVASALFAAGIWHVVATLHRLWGAWFTAPDPSLLAAALAAAVLFAASRWPQPFGPAPQLLRPAAEPRAARVMASRAAARRGQRRDRPAGRSHGAETRRPNLACPGTPR